MVMLRGLRARLGESATLFATGVLTVAGCVVAVGYSRATHVSASSAAAVLLIGMVALAGQGAASVRARRSEIALAQLRGSSGLGLLRAAIAEPSMILLAAAVAGTASGRVIAGAAVHRWVGADASFEMTGAEWATAAGVLVVGVVVVAVVSWPTTYESLTVKLDNLDRPRPATAPTMFLSLLVLVGAVVSVYQARQLGVRHADWVSFMSPALVGLAAGQVGIWLIALLSRLAMSSPRLDRRLRWFITLRRLTRRGDSVAVIRIVAAAVVLGGVAASAWVGSGTWRDQSARVETGGPITFSVPAGALQAYAASQTADPQGRWLMAMSASPDPSGGSYRDVFVDTSRWDRVVGDFFASTPVAGVSSEIDDLKSDQVMRPARGNTFAITFSARSAHRVWSASNLGAFDLRFTISYVDSNGVDQTLQVPAHAGRLPTPIHPGVVGYSAFVPGCARACAVEDVRVVGLSHDRPLLVTGVSFAGKRLLSAGQSGMAVAKSTDKFRVVTSGKGLRLWVTLPYTSYPLLTWKPDSPPAALVTPGLQLERAGGKPQAYGVDRASGPVRLVGEVPALPVVGRTGLLLDLGTALRGAGPPGAETQATVVARADTPGSVVRKLVATGAVERRHTVQQTLASMQGSVVAERTALYALVAVFGLLIAAVSVVSSTAQQRRERRGEAASLRVVGVDVGEVTRGYRVEAQVLGAAVTVVAGVATWVGCRALLAVLPLVDPGQFGLPFDATPRMELVAAVAVLAGLFVSLVVYWDFRLVGRASPPSMLRDENR